MNVFIAAVDGSGPWRQLGYADDDGLVFPRAGEVLGTVVWPGRVIDGEVVE